MRKVTLGQHAPSEGSGRAGVNGWDYARSELLASPPVSRRMNTPSPDHGSKHPALPPSEPAQPGSRRAEQRQRRPGEAGLANEARPGLGTRAAEKETSAAAESDQAAPVRRPPRREQDSASLAQEMQRSTGVSGHSSGA